MSEFTENIRGTFTLEYALFAGAAALAAALTVPIFLRRIGGYLSGFTE